MRKAVSVLLPALVSLLCHQNLLAKEKPNILIIITDEERFLPPNEEHNPEIQKFYTEQLPARSSLIQEGVFFRNHYVASTACSPSRASIFTGHYPPVHGLDQTYLAAKRASDINWLEPGTVPTMGEIFRKAGYSTAYKGKWHISYEELREEGKLVQTVKPDGTPDYENEKKYLKANLLNKFGFDGWVGPEPHDLGEQYLGLATDPNFARQAAEWIKNRDREGEEDPFLLVTSLVNPHDICFYMASCIRGKQLRDKTVPKIPLSPSASDYLEFKPLVQDEYRKGLISMALPFSGPWNYNYKDQEKLLAYYYYLLKRVDRDIAKVLKALKESSFSENTIVLWISDHGDLLGAHGGMQQKWHNAYEEVIHVPMVLSGEPVRKMKKTGTVTGLTSHVDLIPTLASLAGIDADKVISSMQDTHDRAQPLPGTDLTPLIQGKEKKSRDIYFRTDDEITVGNFRTPMLFRFYMPVRIWPWLPTYPEIRGASHIETVVSMVSGQKYKLSRYFDPEHKVSDQWEQYNLSLDPYELNNLGNKGPFYKTLLSRLNEARKNNVSRYLN